MSISICACEAPKLIETVVRKKEDSNEERMVKIPVLLPHLVLQYLFQEVGLEIDDDLLQKYWVHAKQVFLWAAHADFDGSHVPVAVYGDSARYGQGYDQSKITGFWMSLILWRPKSTRMSQWLLWSLDADLSLGRRSENPLIQAVVESLNLCFDGLTPEGKRLPRRFATTEIKGDWEFFYRVLGLTRYWKKRMLCWRCDAENHEHATHSYLDLSDNPTWATTEISQNNFILSGIEDEDVCAVADSFLFLVFWFNV